MRLSDFDCVLCRINVNSGLRDVNIGCDLTFTTVKNNNLSVHSKTSSIYENVYTTTFEIMKNPCNKNVDNLYMTIDESRHIVKWLNQKTDNKFVPIDNKNTSSMVMYFGTMKNVTEIMWADKIVGLSVTFNSNAPYGFGDEIITSAIIANPGETFEIYGDGDEIGTIYPQVKIRIFADGDLSLINSATHKEVIVRNCFNGETLYMDSGYEVIWSDDTRHSTLYNDFEYDYLEIDNSDLNGTKNVFTVSLPCEITVRYLPIRKVGVM